MICGENAGSGEHVFPAVLGGRRICNSIYCGPHNEGFSPLVAALSKQLDEINALLAVRPDHAKKPRVATVAAPNGDQVELSGRGAHSAAEEPGVTKISLMFGGPEGLRAIAYIALTFFARYFPALTPYRSLTEIKDYVLGGAANDFVWWEGPVAPAGMSTNPFRFGHTVALQVSAASQSAYAYLSLFSTLNFAVSFGSVTAVTDESVTIFIDPQAELPKDLQEHRAAGVLFGPFGAPPGARNLKRMIHDGSAEKAVQRLFSEIHHWNLLNSTQPLFDELRRLCVRDRFERKQEVVAALSVRPRTC